MRNGIIIKKCVMDTYYLMEKSVSSLYIVYIDVILVIGIYIYNVTHLYYNSVSAHWIQYWHEYMKDTRWHYHIEILDWDSMLSWISYTLFSFVIFRVFIRSHIYTTVTFYCRPKEDPHNNTKMKKLFHNRGKRYYFVVDFVDLTFWKK